MPAKIKSLESIIELPAALCTPKKPPVNTCSKLVQPLEENPPKCQQLPRQSLDKITYTRLLQSSTTSGSLINGKLAHAHMIKTAFDPCLFLQNTLVNMYFKCGEMDTAQQVFDKMPERNVVSWNLMISGYTRMCLYSKAVGVFSDARDLNLELNKYTYASMLSICAQTGNLELGRIIHGLIIVSELGAQVFLTNSLVDMYSKCRRIDLARIVFDKSDELDDVSWNSLIAGYVKSGLYDEMLQILVRMHRS